MTPAEEHALVERVRVISDRLVLAEQCIAGLNGQVEQLLAAGERLLAEVKRIKAARR